MVTWDDDWELNGNVEDNLSDEIEDYKTGFNKQFYIIYEQKTNGPERIQISSELEKHIDLNELRSGNPGKSNLDGIFIQVEDGCFYPDLIEENGVYLISVKLLKALNAKQLLRREDLYLPVGLVSEGGKRNGEYYLFLPEQLDCLLEGTARFNDHEILTFFELNEEETGELQLFRVKGFPHLIATKKIKRNDFAGLQCVRLENYFDYEGERDRRYRDRCKGEMLTMTGKEFEKKTLLLKQTELAWRLKCLVSPERLKSELATGLKYVLDSYCGRLPIQGLPVDRFLLFFLSLKSNRIDLAEPYGKYFGQTGFELLCLSEAEKVLAAAAEELRDAWKSYCSELVCSCAVAVGQVFERYDNIHNNHRFRLYLQEEESISMIPPLIYDYKSRFQQEVEAAVDLHRFDFTNKNLDEVDFSEKNLTGLRFAGCNLRRARFKGAALTNAVFENADLTGTDFSDSQLNGAEFCGCCLDRTIFDGADLTGGKVIDGRLLHTSFIRSKLTGTQITSSEDIVGVIFFKSFLNEVIFGFPEYMTKTLFQLCDMKKAQFNGEVQNADNIIEDCDFQNANLTEALFRVNMIVNTLFLKTKLNGVNFSPCEMLSGCDFRWSSCFALNFDGMQIFYCNFTYVNLSQLKVEQGSTFIGNDFSFANLTGYGSVRLLLGNKLIRTNLSHCSLKGAWLNECTLVQLDLSNADCSGIYLRQEQLHQVKLASGQHEGIVLVNETWAGEK